MAHIDYDRDIAPSPHRLRVLAYDEYNHCYQCQWGEGASQVCYVDFTTDLSPEDSGRALVGKFVDVAYTFGHVFLAVDARAVKDQGVGPL
jgi:hypothetical protein